MSENIGKIIRRTEYEFLKKFPNTWTDDEKNKIRDYEAVHKSNKYSLPKDYFKKTQIKPLERLNYAWLSKCFKKEFELNERKNLVLNADNRKVFKLVTQYFAKDEAFEQFEDDKIALNQFKLNKGLLIIGGVGCGKTAMMRTFHQIGKKIIQARGDNIMYFQIISCNALVREYEGLEQRDKEYFFDRNIKGVKYFDDFGTEEDASNFGKVNLMKNILEERYLRGSKCHLSTNLSPKEINDKYGFRVYDRLKEMFNVIVMNGTSFRK